MNTIPAQEELIFGVIVLGAGASSRMGRPKLLLPWRLTSVLGHQLATWQRLGARQVAVVCPPPPHPVHEELDRLDFPAANRILNPHPEEGMFSSIQSAARWPDWDGRLTCWVIVLGDQPHVPAAVLERLLAFATRHPHRVVQPSYRGRARHPVILPAPAFRALSDSTAEHLREFLATLPAGTALCEIDHSALDLDLDTPADYERALREFG